MALSKQAREILVAAMCNRKVATEVADAIDAAQQEASQAAAVAPIADPSTATAEDASNKVNEVIAALQAAGLMTP